jgi:hypothetical protein
MLWPLVTIALERMELTKKATRGREQSLNKALPQKILKFKAFQNI